MECQEPKCRHEATTEWNGRKVCHDHYDMHHEHLEKLRNQEDH